MGVPEKSQGTVFVPIPLKVTCHEPERVACKLYIQGIIYPVSHRKSAMQNGQTAMYKM